MQNVSFLRILTGTSNFCTSSTALCSLTLALFSVSSTVINTCKSSARCSQLGFPRFASSYEHIIICDQIKIDRVNNRLNLTNKQTTERKKTSEWHNKMHLDIYFYRIISNFHLMFAFYLCLIKWNNKNQCRRVGCPWKQKQSVLSFHFTAEFKEPHIRLNLFDDTCNHSNRLSENSYLINFNDEYNILRKLYENWKSTTWIARK